MTLLVKLIKICYHSQKKKKIVMITYGIRDTLQRKDLLIYFQCHGCNQTRDLKRIDLSCIPCQFDLTHKIIDLQDNIERDITCVT